MSWSDGRSGPTPAGPDLARRDALERVDGLLRRLAADKLLQDDLRHPDVRKALQHWTGHKRLTQDEADELMEENYRISAVFEKLAELQQACKAAGTGFPLAQVLSGTGLGSDSTKGERRIPLTSSDTAKTENADIGNSIDQSSSPGVRRRSGGSMGVRAVHGETKSSGDEELSWRQAIIEALWKITAVLVCTYTFASVLRYFRSENPLGLSDDMMTGGDGPRQRDEF